MRRLSGQAARHTGRLLHAIATVAMTLLIVLTVAGIAAAWRLSQGPVDLSWLTRRIEEAAAPTRLTIGRTELAWEGFRQGLDRPLDLRLTDVALTTPDGARLLDVPRATVSLSIGNLFLGRIVPRAVELDHARLLLQRAVDGSVSLDLGGNTQAATGAEPLAALLAQLARPPSHDQSAAQGLLSQLQRVRIRDAAVRVSDQQLGVEWQAPRTDIDLIRQPGGGMTGTASLSLALGDQTADLTAVATLTPDARATHLRARLTPVAPAALARVAPALQPLAALDAPVTLDAALDLDADLRPTLGRIVAQVGAGQAHVGQGSVPIHDARVVLTGTLDQIEIESVRLVLQGHEDGPLTTVEASGTLHRGADALTLTGTLGLDQVDFADLPHLWPQGLGGPGARPWIVENVQSGEARNAHLELTLTASPDLSRVALTRLTGTLDGDDLTVNWLRPIPPLEQGQAQLRLLDPDSLDIIVQSGHQQGSGGGPGLTVRDGRMHITGLTVHDQFATIQADIAGPVASAVALLKEPRLHLLDHQNFDLKDPAGDATVALTVTLPLDNKITADDVMVRASAHLTGARFVDLVAHRTLDQGTLDLDVSNDGLTVKGKARLAGIDADLDAGMDFRTGPPNQVVQRATVTGRPTAAQLAAAGLDAGSVVSGPIGMTAAVTEHRNGDGEIAVTADLGQAVLAAAPLGWRKPAGVAAHGSARVVLAHDRLTGIDAIALDGDALRLRGSARVVGDRIDAVTLDRAVLGDTDLHGTVRLPATGPIEADLAGPALDLSVRLAEKTPKQPRPRTPPPPGPAWGMTARFDRVKLAGGQVASGFSLRAQNDGTVFRSLVATGEVGRAPFSLSINPATGGRRVSLTAADIGALLRGLDVVRSMQGGKLVLTGQYNDADPWHPLTGSAEVDDFRVRGVTWLAKLLQGMTLYGLVDVLSGPGVGFSKLVAPFRMDQDGLLLNDARAFSPSLGLTAKGRLDLDAQTADVQGTIVPAYFFNSLLGNVPLVGRLFSPERGGGVFAARYTVKGDLDDPAVSVNPLSALTPGFLREVFGIF